MTISIYGMLKLRYDDITTARHRAPEKVKESLEILRSDILKIEWQYCMPGDVEQLLKKIELQLC